MKEQHSRHPPFSRKEQQSTCYLQHVHHHLIDGGDVGETPALRPVHRRWAAPLERVNYYDG